MPLNQLLKGSSFSAEEVARLSVAYEATLRALHLVDRNDPITGIVAKKIIEIGRSGLDDPAQISARAIKELWGKAPIGSG
jgi:hypothetical protein